MNKTQVRQFTMTPIEQLRALDPTIIIGTASGTALCTASGYRVKYYDGTTATFHGAEQFIPPTGGPYLPPNGDEYARIEIDVEALPQCDGVRGIAVFPVDALRKVYRNTYFHWDVYGGY